MNIVIFSKNRPAQLDLLLRSLKKHFKEWEQTKNSVIFKSTSKEFDDGYDILMKEHPEFRFIRQRTFKSDLLDAVDNSQQFTMFLVDDIVFKQDFSAADPVFGILKNNNQMISLSLRLHPGINYCYATNKSTNVPTSIRNVKDHYKVWRWIGAEGDWGYGISLDGDVFNTSFIKTLLRTPYEYTNPNQLESVLNSPQMVQGIWPTYKCCYDGPSKLLNNPANRVQDEFKNRVENSVSAEELNNMFLEGKRISMDGISEIDNGACHYPLEYKIV